MPKAINLWSYNQASEGAKALAGHTGWKRIRHEGSKYRAGADKVIINWGDSKNFPEAYRASRVINSPHVVGAVTNKLKFFELMGDECRTPEWTTDAKIALGWLETEKDIIVCRKTLTGHSGDGIILFSRVEQARGEKLPVAPLYTRYVPKKTEFRVHFVGKNIIDVQEKRKKKDFEGEANFKIRNHANGFVYCRDNVVAPVDVLGQAQKVMASCRLDFGAIDIIYNEKQQQAYVLEVNTAPGLEGTSIESYARGLKEYIG